jgi:hypothetical protein
MMAQEWWAASRHSMVPGVLGVAQVAGAVEGVQARDG